MSLKTLLLQPGNKPTVRSQELRDLLNERCLETVILCESLTGFDFQNITKKIDLLLLDLREFQRHLSYEMMVRVAKFKDRIDMVADMVVIVSGKPSQNPVIAVLGKGLNIKVVYDRPEDSDQTFDQEQLVEAVYNLVVPVGCW